MKKIIVYIITLIAAISLGVGVISAETAPSTIKMKSTTINIKLFFIDPPLSYNN